MSHKSLRHVQCSCGFKHLISRRETDTRCYRCLGYRDMLSWMKARWEADEARRRKRKKPRVARMLPEVTVEEEFRIPYDEFDV